MDHDRFTIGIDVSARWLDIATWPQTTATRFPNTAPGHRDLLAWLAARNPARIACEASGGYERSLAETLSAAGQALRILPAARVRQFARAGGQLAKTDRIDAAVIAHCAATFDSPAPPTPDPARRDLGELVATRSQLLEALTTARNQGASARMPRLRIMAEARISQLRSWIAELDTAIAEHIAAHPDLARADTLLRSVPGVGPATAAHLLAGMPELGRLSRQKIAALAGVAPFAQDSGQHHGKRRMQGGRTAIRNALYMAALVASRHNARFSATYRRLIAAGKPAKVALGALMRKLLVTLNAILRTEKPWEQA